MSHLRWRKERTRKQAFRVEEHEEVRVEVVGPIAADAEFDIFHVPERAIRRMLFRRFGIAAHHVTSMPLDLDAAGGTVSSLMPAPRRPPPHVPTRLVARVEREISDELFVAEAIVFDVTRSRGARAGLSSELLPLPVTPEVEAEVGSEHRISGSVWGTRDPDIELRVLAPAFDADSWTEHIDPYLTGVAEAFGVSDQDVRDAFDLDFGDYTGDAVRAEVHPSRVNVPADGGEDFAVELYPNHPGASTMLALGAFHVETGALLSSSELMGFSLSEEGLLFRDF
jgi:hypothetical protein